MLWFEMRLSCAMRNNENCAKWSDIVVSTFPESVFGIFSSKYIINKGL